MINIALITDNNYLKQTLTTLKSIILSKNDNSKYTIHIIGPEELEDNCFKELETDDVKINVYKRFNRLYYLHPVQRSQVTNTALFKFLLPEILNDVDKVLYLDDDVIVRDDLTELYDIDFIEYGKIDYKINLVCAVRDTSNLFVPEEENDNSNYFNSGVMLMNLKQMREEHVVDKLIEAKRNQPMSIGFVDQEAFNIVCKDRCKLLPLKYNAMVTSLFDMKSADDELIKKWYPDYKDIIELLAHSKIIHYGAQDKPWNNSFLTLANVWYDVYRQTSLYNEEDDLDLKIKNMKIVVSLTTHLKRVNCVGKAIKSILNQNLKPSKVILYIYDDENKFETVKSLPKEVTDLATDRKLIIKGVFDKDIKGHKKYYYAMQEYFDSVIITIDDDEYYNEDTISNLVLGHLKHPNCVIANRVNLMTFKDKKLLPYMYWVKDYRECFNKESMKLLATGCAGVLYPPKVFSKHFPTEEDIQTSLYQDDLLLKYYEVMNNVPVVLYNYKDNIKHIEDSQETALWKYNLYKGNDECLYNLNSMYPSVQSKILKHDSNLPMVQEPVLFKLLSDTLEKLKEKK